MNPTLTPPDPAPCTSIIPGHRDSDFSCPTVINF